MTPTECKSRTVERNANDKFKGIGQDHPSVRLSKEGTGAVGAASRSKQTCFYPGAGVGKTALVNRLKTKLDLLVCPQSEHLGPIFQSIETQLGLNPHGLKLLARNRRLLRALVEAQRTAVFDGVNWITPKLSSFLESVMERVPIWICTRSERSRDIGHFWTLLVRFTKIELPPLRPAETRACVNIAVESGLVPPPALQMIEWLHHRSKGNPRVLQELCAELAAHHYDPSNPRALRRLDLDRRIHEVFPLAP